MTETRPKPFLDEAISKSGGCTSLLESQATPDMDWHSIKRSFMTTKPGNCPYKPGQIERKLVTPICNGLEEDFDNLSLIGFRRSHDFAYRPVCPNCNGCVSVRVPAPKFAPSKSQRRIMRSNEDLSFSWERNRATSEHFDLFEAYVQNRHDDGDMALMSEPDFQEMVEESSVDTQLACWRNEDGGLVAVCLVDRLKNGISAVYSYFDLDRARRSLGTFVVLDLVKQSCELDLDYLYLGYWVSGSQKMDYKARFSPLEGFIDGRWQLLNNE
ncbi:arginyltransferase [Alphaproteobacteria bacterium]|nr:arginyltransferase [Alphaproteobacteria bacterium]